MKIKTDFVTNSSCASFVIEKKNLTNIQTLLIQNHHEFCEQYHPQSLEYTPDHSGWSISDVDNKILGDTSMDNFDMLWFLLEIGIDEGHIEYKGCYA
jgi:hypothetical protein